MSTDRKDPLPAFCFKVKITATGLEAEAFFKSVGGLKSETEVVDFRAGGVNHSTYRLVGATKWPNLVLKRGFSGSVAMTQWRDAWLKAGVVGTSLTGVRSRLAVPATLAVPSLMSYVKLADPS